MIKRVLTIALIAGAFVTLIGLGTWQMQRLAWKEDLIAQATERPDLPPVPLIQLLAAPEDQWAYRRASVQGRFIGEPVRVFTVLSDPEGPFEGPGYWLMQPFQLAGAQQTLFVNRGFIPFDLEDESVIAPPPAGEVQIQGLVRPNDPVDWMTPDPDYAGNIVYRRDIDQLSTAAGLEAVLPVTLDLPARADDRLPQAGESKFSFSNRHLEYMLTWYGLAAVLLAVVGAAWWRRRS